MEKRMRPKESPWVVAFCEEWRERSWTEGENRESGLLIWLLAPSSCSGNVRQCGETYQQGQLQLISNTRKTPDHMRGTKVRERTATFGEGLLQECQPRWPDRHQLETG